MFSLSLLDEDEEINTNEYILYVFFGNNNYRGSEQTQKRTA